MFSAVMLAGIISGTKSIAQLDLVEYTPDHVDAGNLAIVIGATIVDEEALVVDYDETSHSFSTAKKVSVSQLSRFKGGSAVSGAVPIGSTSSSYSTAISAYILQFPIPDLLALLDKNYYQGRLIGALILKKFGLRGLQFREESTDDQHLQRILTVLELTWRGLHKFLPKPRILPSSLNLDLFPRVNSEFIESYPFEENSIIPEVNLLQFSENIASACSLSQRTDGTLDKLYIDLFARSSSIYARMSHSLMIQVSINGEYFDMTVLLRSGGIMIDSNQAIGKKIKKYLDSPPNDSTLVTKVVSSVKTALVFFNHNIAVTAVVGLVPNLLAVTSGTVGAYLGFSNTGNSLLNILTSLTIIPLTDRKYISGQTKYEPTITRVLFDRPDYLAACKKQRFYSLSTIGTTLRDSFTVITHMFINDKDIGEVKVNFETFGESSRISPSIFKKLKGNSNSVLSQGQKFFPSRPTKIGFLFGEGGEQTRFEYEYNNDEFFGFVSAELETDSYDILLTLNFITHFVTMFEKGKVSICESSFEKGK
jgi:hypothetical protein